LGALAAVTACGSTDDNKPGGAAGSGNPGAAGAAQGVGATGAGAPGVAGAPGAGAPGVAGAPGAGAPGAGAPGVAGAPAGGAPGTAGAPAGGAAGAAGAAGGGSTGTLTSPAWTAVPVQDSSTSTPKALQCNVVTKTDGAGQGPFFIHELEKMDDISLYRQDIRGQYNASAEKGVDMELYVRLIDKTKSDAACGTMVPVPDIDVYIWHTDGQGYYSGFGTRGAADEQKPDTPYSGKPSQDNLENTDRFCRGIQITDANGVAAFLSVFPGWYNGRDLHIHIVCFKKGSKSHGRTTYAKSNEPAWIFTTQFYFDPEFSKSIHEAVEPYKRRTTLSAYTDAMAANEAGNSGRHCTASKVGNKVIAQIQMIVDPS
jgi:protocatechuate 3,4-dioxygenase beta subunit